MTLPLDERPVRAVLDVHADGGDMVALIAAAGLDPSADLQLGDWAHVPFDGADLSGFDFSGARLVGASFARALIAGARFDGAEVERRQLRAAADWDAHAAGWQPRSSAAGTAWADAHLPDGAVFSDAPFAPELVVIPPGRFDMGADAAEAARFDVLAAYSARERPRHAAEIAHRFALGRYAVTMEEFDAFCAASGRRKPRDQGFGRDRQPVIGVSHADARAYCDWLGARTGIAYRLPSEVEWEYACRAGTTTAFWFGDTVSSAQATYDAGQRAAGSLPGRTSRAPVAVDAPGAAANPFGLVQMHGNVEEWCADTALRPYPKAADVAPAPAAGAAPYHAAGSGRAVVRGGAWVSHPGFLRAASRALRPADRGDDDLGFRVARDLRLGPEDP
ncbi:MAG: SUMF1/EgtB/PvdO family nonheme iron enzyme [Pseudomonadota bacterium]